MNIKSINKSNVIFVIMLIFMIACLSSCTKDSSMPTYEDARKNLESSGYNVDYVSYTDLSLDHAGLLAIKNDVIIKYIYLGEGKSENYISDIEKQYNFKLENSKTFDINGYTVYQSQNLERDRGFLIVKKDDFVLLIFAPNDEKAKIAFEDFIGEKSKRK